MLKAKLDNLDGVSDEVKAHYIETDGKFYLDVGVVDGLAVEDVSGLKSTVEALRNTEKELTASLRSANTAMESQTERFKDIDPDAARTALGKLDEINNWDGNTKIKDAVKLAVETAEGKIQGKMDELVRQQTEAVTKIQTDLDSSQSQLQDAIVDSKIIEAISVEKGNVSLLMPHVKTHVRMVKGSNGRFKPEVIKEDGTVRIGDSQGNDMTITQLVQEMKGQETFAAAFTGANQSGSGRDGNNNDGNDNNRNNRGTDSKVINSSDTKEVSANLEDIASGKVIVDMEK